MERTGCAQWATEVVQLFVVRHNVLCAVLWRHPSNWIRLEVTRHGWARKVAGKPAIVRLSNHWTSPTAFLGLDLASIHLLLLQSMAWYIIFISLILLLLTLPLARANDYSENKGAYSNYKAFFLTKVDLYFPLASPWSIHLHRLLSAERKSIQWIDQTSPNLLLAFTVYV